MSIKTARQLCRICNSRYATRKDGTCAAWECKDAARLQRYRRAYVKRRIAMGKALIWSKYK